MLYKEAKAKDLTFYFTGKPCKRGHIARRYVSTMSCEKCVYELATSWQKKNRERTKESLRKSHSKHREKRNEKCRKYHLINRASRLLQMRLWHYQHRDKVHKRQKDWRSRNRETVNSYTQNRRARKFKNGGKHTGRDVIEILKMQKGRCAYCRDRLSSFQVDHIQPLSRGGGNNRANLQLLCADCNLTKHDNDPIVHAQSLGLLL